jgi:hypothetical protein
VRLLDGTARLKLDGEHAEPTLSLLPSGVFFTETGYLTLTEATTRLQDDVRALRARAEACAVPVQVVQPAAVSIQQGWGSTTLVVVGVVGVVVGLVVGVKVAK